MIQNGEVPIAPSTAIYTVPAPGVGTPDSGNAQEFNLFRFVNGTATTVELSIWLNVNGTPRLLTPNELLLPPGSAWDDVPVFQLPVGATIIAQASASGVDWNLNSYFVTA